MKVKSFQPYFLLLVLFVLILSACIPTAAPLFLDPGFNTMNITEITVLPVADIRGVESKAKKELPKLDKWSHYGLRTAFRLSKSKYNLTYLKDRSLVENITEDDLTDTDPDWIKNLGPSETRWVMLPVLNSFGQKIDITNKVTVEISAYLFDKATGNKIWFHKNVSKYSTGIGLMSLGFSKDAIALSMQQMAFNLPKNN